MMSHYLFLETLNVIFVYVDLAKLEKEERICRKLQHPNIGITIVTDANLISLTSSIT